ncbi:6-carboxytetrahydropterin synthase QueD [Candidatus Roizmanbacteria bacterium RIFCSPHIGHO2_01_FULL_39_8]|uniref:6-carboxy-5,6,7,8-tetrahydropterin synthase n=3 Tax=Candidatus Roizmaniibacteriota TaxID=1752723 RepID=A0A1F7GSY2_9BACT|nr:MAG: 6-carboxytetrahydropterin synthase QueD [Candidatus Roizmanbacteria bacterium RIFCSPHIGHO2_01_FULL_39_8]OGK27214.1 MAG: 6-carboxytetrahydropterin synthase QueD [Candidatus Roizmanbacteria bacterium RIFCSPHIGHO2_02_FULL_39_9]OGK37428.1 MAG: 6-carboxytetrahydropterin synthase QueD [Candidatus Roizmanbacteria bacterium RIFCSPHIGHO2_12_FULL_39_8]
MTITKIIEFDMGHRIPNHKSQCRNLHGHRYKLELNIEGEVQKEVGRSEEGMVFDFIDVKTLLMNEVHSKCDHAFMFYEKDPVLAVFAKKNKSLKFVSVPFIPTAENISDWIFNILSKKIEIISKKKFHLQGIKLWETPTSSAFISKKN